MYQHTAAVHGGTIGRHRGIYDYKYQLLETFKDNLTRQVDEGRRQAVMEDFQSKNKVIVLNSKLDFIKPFKTQLQVHTGNVNSAPGKKDQMTVRFTTDRRQEDNGKTNEDTDRGQEDKRKTNEDRIQQTNKRKADSFTDSQEEELASAMKKRRIKKLNSSAEFQANIYRSSTPVPNSFNSSKRKLDQLD